MSGYSRNKLMLLFLNELMTFNGTKDKIFHEYLLRWKAGCSEHLNL